MLTVLQTRADYEQAQCKTAIVPLGAVEQHGVHLPLGTDYLLAETFARRLAAPLNAYLLPAIPVTSSLEHGRRNGTVSIKAETLALVIRDIGESLRDSGFESMIIVNFHGGNWIVKPTIRRMNRELAPLRAIAVDALVGLSRHGEIFAHVEHDVHAGEFETSLMMYAHPELVRSISAPDRREFVPQHFMDYFDVPDITPDGSWGFPEEASAAKGEQALTAMVEAALDYIRLVEETAERVRHEKGKE